MHWDLHSHSSCWNINLYTHQYVLFHPLLYQVQSTVCWNIDSAIHERSNGMEVAWWMVVAKFDASSATPKLSAMLMETADGTCKTSVPAITLGHRLCNFVYPLGVCKCLIVDNFTRFCDAKNSDFSACNSKKRKKLNNYVQPTIFQFTERSKTNFARLKQKGSNSLLNYNPGFIKMNS